MDSSATAYAYEPDVTVEEQEAPVIPIRPRTTTDGALTMQVYKEGQWHRRTPDLATTSCGTPIHSAYDPVRREELCFPLCSECFTKFEFTKAAERAAKEGNP